MTRELIYAFLLIERAELFIGFLGLRGPPPFLVSSLSFIIRERNAITKRKDISEFLLMGVQ
jgi:hypothetical protein